MLFPLSLSPELWLYTCLILSVCAQEPPIGFYTIVGSKFIRPHADYHVAVNLHDAAAPNNIRLTIQNSADGISMAKEITVHPNSTEAVVFKIAAVKTGNYKLIAEGTSGVRFYKETELIVNTKRHVMLIQTDKALYKPGDTLKFRVLVLDSNTKPIDRSGGLHIRVLDGRSNVIKRWTNATLHSGVFFEDLQLSDYPVLGKWAIEVEMMGETIRRTFEVAEFVLTKFEVLIETEKNVLYKNGKIMAIIGARYPFGKMVRGEAVVTVQPKLHGAYQPLIGDLISRKVIKVATKGAVEFDIVSDLKLSEEYERELVMDVIFEEERTGRIEKAQTTITIRQSQYKISVVSPKMDRFVYDEGDTFELEVQVSRHDAMPLNVEGSSIELAYSTSFSDGIVNTEQRQLDKNGRAEISWLFPRNESGFYIRAKYMDVTEGLGYASKIVKNHSPMNIPNLKIKVLTKKPTLGSTINIEIQSETPMSYYTYQIFGHGDILISDTVKVPNVLRHNIQFLATFAMVPEFYIIVYHIVDGKMSCGSEVVLLRDNLQNEITLTDSPVTTTTGTYVNLNIKTRPYSHVFLMAVDQRALLLKSGNDLSTNIVFDELEKYAKHENGLTIIHTKYSAKFEQIGAFVLSNIYDPSSGNQNRLEPIAFEDRNHHQHDVLTIKKTDIGPAHLFLSHTKPPRAGPYAFSRIPSSKWKRQRVLVERYPLDTWMFDSYQAGPDGILKLRKEVPDKSTSWVISAFSVDPVTGLAITKEPTTLNVVQKLTLAMNLPYSIKRGEVVSIQIVAFNYLNAVVETDVTFHNEQQELDFVGTDDKEAKAAKIELYRRQRVSIQPNDAAVATFLIQPKQVGPLNIKVSASHQLASESINRILLVEHEGVPINFNEAVLIDLRQQHEQSSNLVINVPKNAIADSTRIRISIAGEMFGSTINNIDSLISMPHGCGEQSMMHLASNIVVLNYMNQTGRLTPEMEMKSKKLIHSGYQRQLNYHHQNGSFSVFGESDKIGSIWLTAFVARSFQQAVHIIDVEERLIEKALQFLAASQEDSGRFTEIGSVIYADMQNRSGPGVALTAYTLITFLENKSILPKYRSVINKAMDYIVKNLEALEVYDLALAAYALQLSEHNAKDYVLRLLDAKATRVNGSMYWTKSLPESEEMYLLKKRSNSINTEMTAYALLAYLHAEGLSASTVQITKWLLSQRNDAGGFESTQDTLIGLQALAKVAEQLKNVKNDMRIALRYGKGTVRDFTINAESNTILQQEFQLPNSIRELNVTATGQGVGFLKLSYTYNVNVTGGWPRFTVDPQVNRNSNSDYLHLTICTSFIPYNDSKVSNMAIMEVHFPSGFTADLDAIPSLESTENVMKVEPSKDDTVMFIYFQNLGVNELCPTITAFRKQKVAMQKPSMVAVYDYYDTGRQSRMFYSYSNTGLCDICEEECPKSCKAQASQQRSEDPPSNIESSANIVRNSLISMGIAFLFATI